MANTLQQLKDKVVNGETTIEVAMFELGCMEIDAKEKIAFANELRKIKPVPMATIEWSRHERFGTQVHLKASHEKSKDVYLQPHHYIEYYRAFQTDHAKEVLAEAEELIEKKTTAKS